jgi:hypothetical protein
MIHNHSPSAPHRFYNPVAGKSGDRGSKGLTVPEVLDRHLIDISTLTPLVVVDRYGCVSPRS